VLVFLVLYGRRASARPLGKRDAYCGACIAKTRQDAFEVEQYAHLYFVPVWSSGRRLVARCSACGALVPVVERAEATPRGSKRIDAFLDATAPELVVTQKGNAATAVGALLGLAGFAALGAVLVMLGDAQPGAPVGISVFMGTVAIVVALVVGVYRRVQPFVVRRAFAPRITPRIERVLARTRRSVNDVIERARHLGYIDLANLLARPEYASLVPRDELRGPPDDDD
jgi:hypothetical protein